MFSVVYAHMKMSFPPPRGSVEAGFTGNDIDYNMASPIDAAQYPCKQVQVSPKKLPITAGSTITAQLAGGAPHGGGICQFALSYDSKTWISIKDVEGPCMIDSLTYPVTIPSKVPNGDAVFMWSWINRLGNREYYTNCADIVISGSTGNSFTGPKLLVTNIMGTTIPEGVGIESVAIPLMDKRPIISFSGTAVSPTPPSSSPVETPFVTKFASPSETDAAIPLDTKAETPAVNKPEPIGTLISEPTPTVIIQPTATPITPPSSSSCTQGDIICTTLTEFSTCVWGTLVPQPMALGTNCQQNGNSISIVFAGQASGPSPAPSASPSTSDPETPNVTPDTCVSGVVTCLDSGDVQSCLDGTPHKSTLPAGSICAEKGNTAVISMNN
eukprot:NODE_843_length_3758_cov_0.336977.p1 type:complete len:384 gc:universal NODE_843_length_3758_cov_0.336977:1734-583(-)